MRRRSQRTLCFPGAKLKPMAKKKSIPEKDFASDQDLWRDSRGLYKHGNPGGPGRPFQRQERFLLALNETVTSDRWLKIIKRAIKDAEDGDRHAREWLSKWLLGQPEAVNDDEKSTIIDVLTDGTFVKWIEDGAHNGNNGAGS